MDVLFGSIDVRDLLPTPSLDENSPLSAPDLRLLTEHLQVRSLEIKSRVRDHVLSHRGDFSEIFSLCSDSVSRSDDLCSSIFQALEILDPPLDIEIRDLADKIRCKKKELKERRETLEVVKQISSFLERVESVKECFRNGRLVEAAVALIGLKDKIFIDESGDSSAVIFGLLKEEWVRCSDELQDVLAKMIESAVQFDIKSETLKVNSKVTMGKSENCELRIVLEALEIVGAINYGFAKVGDLIVKHVMKPVISKKLTTVFSDGLNQNNDDNYESVLKLVSSPQPQGSKDDVSVYSELIRVIKFIHKSICYGNANWMIHFGKLTWSRISELVITFFLSKDVPNDALKIAEFQSIIKYTAEFEAFLKEICFISGTDSKEEKLSLFVHNIEVHFATQKRNAILAEARNLILKCSFSLSPNNNVECAENYVELLFEKDRYIVSEAAVQLMDLVHQTLKDVCLSPIRVALEFYHTARDVLLLFKAIVPVKLEKQIDTISQEAIILHNDFIFLSQEMFALAFEYRSDFPVNVKEIAVFADIAPYFRQMAEDILQKQVQLANLSLKKAIDCANGYQNTHEMQHYTLAEFSIVQVTFILEKMHILWKPFLPMSAYKRCMCEIMDTVFSRIAYDILLLDDIAPEETLQLQRLINMTLERLSSLIDSLHDQRNENEIPSSPLPLEGTLPSLCKLRKLADILDMSLRSIIASWENKELISCGFTASEIINFIKATFMDSTLRKNCILMIGSSS
ncbi:Centromere/kinetochore protein zw10-like protein [Zostera marina]|uniref:Centromere/kinetochore protein zw10-like protein n=1 Tax=Zostera marina TaxID=29655 RepID=A0A0K9PN93_ZOSMR|nr:Centromere/kinetochore protein zw10-like protein [Zostera marina]